MPNSDAVQWYREPREELHLSTLCERSLGRSVNHLTATHFYHVACENEMENLRKIVVNWFLVNLMDPSMGQPHLLRRIPIELMTELVASPNLYVVHGEKELYELLCMWMYLRIHLGSEPGDLQNQEKARETMRQLEAAQMTPAQYFAKRYGPHGSFLDTAAGLPYVKVFQKLRTEHLLGSGPEKLIGGHLLNSWLDNAGHFEVDSSADESFLRRCKRLGIVLTEPSKEWWRLPNVDTDLDIYGKVENNKLKIRLEYTGSASKFQELYQGQNIQVRGYHTAVNEGLQLGHSLGSSIVRLREGLESGEPIPLCEASLWKRYPLKISINILIGVPPPEVVSDEQL